VTGANSASGRWRAVLQLPEQRFIPLMEGVMLVSGVSILWMAWP